MVKRNEVTGMKDWIGSFQASVDYMEQNLLILLWQADGTE